MSKESGIGVRYTNHSLRATAITRMFNYGAEEKIIAETSGHRSTKALRVYEHPSEKQMKQVTSVINQSEMVVDQNLRIVDVKIHDNSTAQVGSAKQSGVHPDFSGTFSNCTINVSFK